jgi:RHS repeat-associated protein
VSINDDPTTDPSSENGHKNMDHNSTAVPNSADAPAAPTRLRRHRLALAASVLASLSLVLLGPPTEAIAQNTPGTGPGTTQPAGTGSTTTTTASTTTTTVPAPEPQRLTPPEPTTTTTTATGIFGPLAAPSSTAPVVAVTHGIVGGFTWFRADGTLQGSAASTGCVASALQAPTTIVDASINQDSTGCIALASDGAIFASGSATFEGAPVGLFQGVTRPVAVQSTSTGRGYWVLSSDGAVFRYGDAANIGGVNPLALNNAVDLAVSPSGNGLWILTSDGAVFALGDAGPFGGINGTGLLQGNDTAVSITPTPSGAGFWIAAAKGGVFTRGVAPFFGGLGAQSLTESVAGMAAMPTGAGYLLATRDGRAQGFGDASGAAVALPLKSSSAYIGIAPTKTGRGYWALTLNGAVFSFGDAVFRGTAGVLSAGTVATDIVTTPSGDGYWILTSDGAVFSLGDAQFFGGANNGALAGDIAVGLAPTPTGAGYWILSRTGAIFSFGDAPALGGINGSGLLGQGDTAVDLVSTPSGAGFWIAARDGGVFTRGNAQFYGGAGTPPLVKKVVGMARTPAGDGYWLTTSDGGIFGFGAATNVGGANNGLLGGQAAEAIAGNGTNGGYWLITGSGGIFSFGSASYFGAGALANVGPVGFREQLGGSNPSVNFCGGCNGDPVDSATGAYYESFTDLAAPGRGPGAVVTRSYSSANADVRGAFGFGWSTPEESRINAIPEYLVGDNATTVLTRTVIQENGSRIQFVCDTLTGAFKRPDRVNAELTQTAAPGYPGAASDCRKPAASFTLVRDSSRSSLVFDAFGRTLSVTDQNGYTLNVVRDGLGRVSQLVNASGRGVQYAWNAAGFIASATDIGAGALARTVTYGYSPAGDLISVTDPRGETMTFAYDGAHRVVGKRRAAEVDKGAAGESFTMVYGGDCQPAVQTPGCRVVSQTDESGATMTWVWAIDPSSKTGTVTVTDAGGNVAEETFLNGIMTKRVTGKGSTVEVTTETTYDVARLLPLSRSVRGTGANPDTSAARVTQMSYFDDGAKWKETAPDGTVTEFYVDPFKTPVRTVTQADSMAKVDAVDTRGYVTRSMAGPASQFSPYWSQFTAAHSGKCFGPAGGWAAATSATLMTQQSCDNSDNRSIRILWGTDGKGARLAGPNDSLCLQWKGADAPVGLAACNVTDLTLRWDVRTLGNQMQIRVSSNEGLPEAAANQCLDVSAASAVDGALMRGSQCKGLDQASQLFSYSSRPQATGSDVQTTTFERGDPARPEDVTATVDAEGKRSTASYDPTYGTVTRARDAVGNVTTTSYDLLGRPVSVTSPRGNNVEPAISTFAGNGTGTTTGNGGQATSAGFADPYDLAVDSAGNTYVAEPVGNVVRRITPAGIVSVVAGTGTAGSTGDGGQATAARLNRPVGLEVGPNNFLYIAELDGHRIRRVNLTTGTISTFAGTGTAGSTGDGGSATAARLNQPAGLAFGPNALYVSEFVGHRVRKIDLTTLIISTVAGTGVAGFSGDGGPATAARLQSPLGIAVDSAGNLFIPDYANDRVRIVSPSGVISTFAGTGVVANSGDGGPATAAQVARPVSVVAVGSSVLVASQAHSVRRIDAAGRISTIAGTAVSGFAGDGGLATDARLNIPGGMIVTAAGDLLIADRGNSRVRRVAGVTAFVAAPPGGFTTTTAYDPGGLVTSVTDPSGAVTATEYDGDGKVVRVTQAPTAENPAGNSVLTGYDSRGLKISETTADGLVRRWEYDVVGRVVKEIDPSGQQTTTSYDVVGRVTGTTDELGRTTAVSSYSAWGEPLVTVDRSALTTTTSYDVMGRVKTVDFQDPGTPDLSFTYDTAGKPTKVTASGVGDVTRSYDNMQRLASVTDTNDRTVSYGYDKRNLTTRITYPPFAGNDAPQVTRTFDDVGRLTRVTDWATRQYNFVWDPDSNLTSATYPNGRVDTRSYDNRNLLAGITQTGTGKPTVSYGYTWDPAGRLTQYRSNTPGAAQVSNDYTHDRRSRMTGWSGRNFGFDTQGNLAGTPSVGAAVHDAAGQLCAAGGTDPGTCAAPAAGATTYGFDPRGNRTTVTAAGRTETYGYDQRDNLTSVPGGTTYAYDGEGNRATTTTGGDVNRFTWDREGELPMLLLENDRAYVYGPWGSPLAQIDTTGAVTYLHGDHQGSVRTTTNAAGDITSTVTYDPYGQVTSRTGGTPTPFGYAGEYTDAETGFVYLRARHYDPATGEFLQLDPKVDGTNQPYLYGAGSPGDHVDPNGEWPKWVDKGIQRAKRNIQAQAAFVWKHRDVVMAAVAVAGAVTCLAVTAGACAVVVAAATVSVATHVAAAGVVSGQASAGEAAAFVGKEAAIACIPLGGKGLLKAAATPMATVGGKAIGGPIRRGAFGAATSLTKPSQKNLVLPGMRLGNAMLPEPRAAAAPPQTSAK